MDQDLEDSILLTQIAKGIYSDQDPVDMSEDVHSSAGQTSEANHGRTIETEENIP